MSESMRLDKLLSHMGIATRSECRRLAKQGAIEIDGVPAKDPACKVVPSRMRITVHGEPVVYREYIYLMMNKPAGVISATEDARLRTVLDLLPASLVHFSPFPVGRLDRDTEGLLLLTNDGKLAHELLSPRRHVPKTYFARIDGMVGEADVRAFRAGVTLEDGYVTMPAELCVERADTSENQSEIRLTIYEGKFHQVKRMFAARGTQVTYLKRLSMGPLLLDAALPLGSFRELTEAELQALKGREE